MKPYMLMAVEFCYKIEIVEPNTPWKFDGTYEKIISSFICWQLSVELKVEPA